MKKNQILEESSVLVKGKQLKTYSAEISNSKKGRPVVVEVHGDGLL